MSRNLSTSSQRDKKQREKGTTNRISTNSSSTDIAAIPGDVRASRWQSSFGYLFMKRERNDSQVRNVERKDIDDMFQEFGQLIHASRRPLPTQTGDGTYNEHKEFTGLKEDLKAPRLKDGFIGELWNTLEHPPLSYMGDDFTFRKADGSYNNIMYPHLGAANTPYARTCKPRTIMPGALPDPGVIFDCLMKRYKYKPHPNGVSSILWYLASIIIHDLFRTDHSDFNKSTTSSYLDLSPLYGSNQTEQNGIRTFKDGKLKPDCFTEKRILGFPPGVGCLLIMFNRFHNYVADQLVVINEGGRFTRPTHGLTVEMEEKSWFKFDNDIFQTARVEMGQEVGTKKGVDAGTGNQVSAEFNLFYRWHSCISDRDDKWTEGVYSKLWPGRKPSEVTLQEMIVGLEVWERSILEDPFLRPFGNFTRDSDGNLDDDELVECLTESIEDLAGSFGANNVPQCMRPIELLGIIQSRKWNVAGLNEFRKHFGLKAHATFEDINPDPKVANHLRHLYDHPDFVELYPGIVAEDYKAAVTPGVGICPTYTVSRVILSDAVCLVRGDRFYTIDYHPRNLTNWGFNEVTTDLAINQGCVFYKLFTRAFPSHFRGDSIYAHYPMTIPSATKEILVRIDLNAMVSVKYVLENPNKYKVIWGEGFTRIMGIGGSKFMLSGDGAEFAKQKELMANCLYHSSWKSQVQEFYEYITQKLLFEKAYQLDGTNQVDIVRDVGNITNVHFAAKVFSFPMKNAENPHGLLTEHELYMILAIHFVAIFFDLDPATSFGLQQAAVATAKTLGALIEINVKIVKSTRFTNTIERLQHSYSPLKDYGVHLVKQLLKSGLSTYDVAWSQILPTAGAMVANQGQVFAQSLDYYLGEGKEHLPEINRVAKLDTPVADHMLLHYAMEGIRLSGTYGLYRKAAENDVIKNGDETVNVRTGDNVFVSFVDAARDPNNYPSPSEVRLDRPMESYIHYGMGTHGCLGKDASTAALTAMWKIVGRLDNLRRAPGPQGELKKIPRPDGFFIYMSEDRGSYFPFPTTMKINWDGQVRLSLHVQPIGIPAVCPPPKQRAQGEQPTTDRMKSQQQPPFASKTMKSSGAMESNNIESIESKSPLESPRETNTRMRWECGDSRRSRGNPYLPPLRTRHRNLSASKRDLHALRSFCSIFVLLPSLPAAHIFSTYLPRFSYGLHSAAQLGVVESPNSGPGKTSLASEITSCNKTEIKHIEERATELVLHFAIDVENRFVPQLRSKT
ncbi:hypothetical protein B7494_g6827 [Chlorociboria aeruginascens]|nr:hypothetical protein B7494_g6827 [Chlorociboria aeruginascens]